VTPPLSPPLRGVGNYQDKQTFKINKKLHKIMAKIMLGIATLFIGEKAICEAIAAGMNNEGANVRVESAKENEVFNVI